MIRQRDIAFEGKDWKGRTLTLLKSTIKNHVAYYHNDALFVVDELKAKLASPIEVRWNHGARSEQAVYGIPVGDHPYLQANIKERGLLRRTLIVTFYGVSEFPKGKLLWPLK